MTARISLDDMTSDQLDQLHAEIDRLTAELADYDERAERQKQRADEAEQHLRNIAQGGANADAVQAEIGEMIAQTHELRDQLRRAEAELADRDAAESADAAAGSYANGNEHAIAHPQPWLHVVFTSPDPTTANTSALALADHLRAEFPGISMRISSNAVEGEPDPFGYEERERTGRNAGLTCDEPAIPRFTYRPVTPEMGRAATERARQAAADSERSAAWFAATGGVLGAPVNEAEQSRTTPDNPPTSSTLAEQLRNAIEHEVYEYRERTALWGETEGVTEEIARLATRKAMEVLQPQDGTHVYLSTGCLHGDHDYCKSMTGLNGAKRPASCKKCGAKCVCGCHTAPPVPRDPCPHCEASSDRVPRDQLGQHIADHHPEVGAGA